MSLVRHSFAIAFAALTMVPGATLAQESTPEASPAAVACTIAPRPEADLSTLMASPVPAIGIPGDATGAAADPATLSAIERTLREADACAAAGDYLRLAALYSDNAIASGAFAVEKLPITSGTPDASPPATNTEPLFSDPFVISGTVLPDGRVLATVQRADQLSEIVMVEDGDRWLIDSDEMAIASVDGPPLPMDIPIAVLQAVVNEVNAQFPDQVASITIVSAEVVEWPDAALGCPRDGEFVAAVITPGYRMVVAFDGGQLEVHTDMDGNARSC